MLLAGLVGGWPGALLAQRVVRHKSGKKSFQVKFRATVIANLALIAALAYYAR